MPVLAIFRPLLLLLTFSFIFQLTFASEEIPSAPEKWRIFESINKEGQVYLRWQTKLSKRPKGFEIERSTDGRNFEPIGKLAGNSKGSDKQRYRYIDRLPVPGEVYYRLRLVDNEGDSYYSEVTMQNIEVIESALLNLNPNPNDMAFTIYFPEVSKGKTVVRLLSVTGDNLFEGELDPGLQSWGLLWDDLPKADRYLLQIVLQGKTYWKWVVREE